MKRAIELIRGTIPACKASMVLPNDQLLTQAQACGLPPGVELRVGGLPVALSLADVAIASTGTVTMECAYFGVPTVALYKTSWSTYQIARRIVRVKYIAMPNLLAEEEIFPEFIQDAATAENIAQAAVALLRDEGRRENIKSKLREVRALLGGPGASGRAAQRVLEVVAPAGFVGLSGTRERVFQG
jgi:lipid-A-disaccharide synthase